MPRLFTAIALPADVAAQLSGLELGDSPALARSSPDQLHLTLHFIGEISDTVAEGLRRRFRGLPIKPFGLSLQGVGCFPPGDRPGFLWAGVEKTDRLIELRDAIGERMAAAGQELETRRWNPHVTLARLDAPAQELVDRFLTQYKEFSVTLEVNEFAVYSVERDEAGARYNVVERFALT